MVRAESRLTEDWKLVQGVLLTHKQWIYQHRRRFIRTSLAAVVLVMNSGQNPRDFFLAFRIAFKLQFGNLSCDLATLPSYSFDQEMALLRRLQWNVRVFTWTDFVDELVSALGFSETTYRAAIRSLFQDMFLYDTLLPVCPSQAAISAILKSAADEEAPLVLIMLSLYDSCRAS